MVSHEQPSSQQVLAADDKPSLKRAWSGSRNPF